MVARGCHCFDFFAGVEFGSLPPHKLAEKPSSQVHNRREIGKSDTFHVPMVGFGMGVCQDCWVLRNPKTSLSAEIRTWIGFWVGEPGVLSWCQASSPAPQWLPKPTTRRMPQRWKPLRPTAQITDPAPVAFDLKQRRHRRVRCICFVSHRIHAHFWSAIR